MLKKTWDIFKVQNVDHPASILRKVYIWAMDMIVLVAIIVVGFMLAANLQEYIDMALFQCMFLATFGLANFVILPHFWKGKTLGCKALSASICTLDGKPAKWWNIVIRYFTMTIIFGIGFALIRYFQDERFVIIVGITLGAWFIMVIFRKDHMSLHDLISRTYIRTTYQDKKKKKKKNKKKKDKKKTK